MIRRMALMAGLVGIVSLTGCFSLDYDDNVRQINHYSHKLDDMRKFTNKYFFNYDADNPFDE
jgi:hypothetical protein